jgi:hypothetical protein
MNGNLMILPAHEYQQIRLVKIPDDFEQHEAFRHVTGIIAAVEENNPDYQPDDIVAALEEHGIECVEFMLGPALD